MRTFYMFLYHKICFYAYISGNLNDINHKQTADLDGAARMCSVKSWGEVCSLGQGCVYGTGTLPACGLKVKGLVVGGLCCVKHLYYTGSQIFTDILIFSIGNCQ